MFLKLTRFLLYASLFSVVLVSGATFFPFIGVKYFFFRTMVELALGCALLWWAFEAGDLWGRLKSVWRKPLFLAVSAFVLVFLLAALFAYDPSAAFWSNFERGEGAFQMLHYYAFFVLLLLAFEKEEEWRRMAQVFLGAAVVMILYGMGAAMITQGADGGNANPLGLIGPYLNPSTGQAIAPTYLGRLFAPDARFQGSLGNPAYVAPFLMFAMFFAAWLWLTAKGRNWRHNAGYGALILFFLLFFFLTQTRGAVLGLGAGVFAALLFAALINKRFRLPAAAILLVLVATWSGLLFFRNSPAIQKLPGSRLLYLDIHELTAQTRFWTWGSAWQGFKERPILGWGPENFSAVFDKYFDVRHWVPGQNTETWFDRAHSVVFDYLAETGILGFLAYLSIFGAVSYEFLRKTWRGQHGPAGTMIFGLILAMPIAYLVQALILFDVLPVYLGLFLYLAFFMNRMNHIQNHGSVS